MLDDTVPLESVPDPMPDLPSEDSPQPKLSEILHAVQKCTASVDDLKERHGGLKECVSPPVSEPPEDQGENHCCKGQSE